MNTNGMASMSKYVFALVLTTNLATAFASTNVLSPPKTLEYEGKSYELTSTAKMAEPSGNRLFYGYTTNNETKDQWTTMVIVQFSSQHHLNDAAWAKDLKSYFDASTPRPFYNIVNIGGQPFARYLNPPSNGQPSESGVMRFIPNGCGGQVVFQYIEKIDASNVQLAWANNARALNALTKHSWQPECVATN